MRYPPVASVFKQELHLQHEKTDVDVRVRTPSLTTENEVRALKRALVFLTKLHQQLRGRMLDMIEKAPPASYDAQEFIKLIDPDHE